MLWGRLVTWHLVCSMGLSGPLAPALQGLKCVAELPAGNRKQTVHLRVMLYQRTHLPPFGASYAARSDVCLCTPSMCLATAGSPCYWCYALLSFCFGFLLLLYYVFAIVYIP